MIPFIHLGSIQIPTYFFVISASLSVLLLYLSKRVVSFNKSRKVAFDLALLLMVAGFVGGRLMHVFYEEWAYYRENPLFILYFWNGGFVFLGGLIACLIAGFIFAKLKKISFAEWSDFFTPLLSLSHALGRVGCVLSGCCFGTYCELPWSVSGRHPTALYLVFGELFIFTILIFLEKTKKIRKAGDLFASWLMMHSLMRFIVEYYRDDFRGLFIRLPLLGSLSIAQLISLAVIVAATVFLCIKPRPHSPKASS
jgi:phosphatidylglycerol---prolipoprotein diacylglyceryl transferase